MRVGILTFHFCHNYGGVLQCLALQQALSALGINSEVIDYNPSRKVQFIRRCGAVVGRSLTERLLNRLGECRFGADHYRKFDAFRRQHLRLSDPFHSIKELRKAVERYDGLIVGSDQVWNSEWNWPVYFLDFATGYRGRRISYAACFGHECHGVEFLNKLSTWLAPFDAISVRNAFSRDIVARFGKRESTIVTDPTLLVDLRQYASHIHVRSRRFLLVYSLGTANSQVSASIVAQIKNALQLPVVVVTPGSVRGSAFSAWDQTVEDAGPAEWLWLFANAEFVCTDSFHGTILAIKHGKPFLVFDHRQRSSRRLYDLADRLGFRDRLIAEPRQLRGFHFEAINEYTISSRIDAWVQTSYEFLKSTLQQS